MVKRLPDVELLRSLLDYDPDTGVLTWKARESKHFRDKRSWSTWNARYAGKSALTGDTNGYLGGFILSRRYFAHRVCFTMHHGYEPALVDHIDGNRRNNRIANLRESNHADNHKNVGKVAGSGAFGVRKNPKISRWTSVIGHNGKTIHLGSFKTEDEALAARLGAEKALGFYRLHGRREPYLQQPADTPNS
jgi:hypothetical protein